jgi:DNA-binding transcriptional LysR family regulator
MIKTYETFNFDKMMALQNASRPSLWLHWLRLSGKGMTGTIQGNRFANSNMLITAAMNGLGYAVTPVHYVREELLSGKLAAPFGAAVPSGAGYWIAVQERKWNDMRVQMFRLWLHDLVRREARQKN